MSIFNIFKSNKKGNGSIYDKTQSNVETRNFHSIYKNEKSNTAGGFIEIGIVSIQSIDIQNLKMVFKDKYELVNIFEESSSDGHFLTILCISSEFLYNKDNEANYISNLKDFETKIIKLVIDNILDIHSIEYVYCDFETDGEYHSFCNVKSQDIYSIVIYKENKKVNIKYSDWYIDGLTKRNNSKIDNKREEI